MCIPRYIECAGEVAQDGAVSHERLMIQYQRSYIPADACFRINNPANISMAHFLVSVAGGIGSVYIDCREVFL